MDREATVALWQGDDQGGRIRAGDANPDYTIRPESDTVAIVRARRGSVEGGTPWVVH